MNVFGQNDDLTILWALRSQCNLRCSYCYFGGDNNQTEEVGKLSHQKRNDLSILQISNFIDTIKPSSTKIKIFIAGGEPLLYPEMCQIVQQLKRKNCQVILCTNGFPLFNKQTCRWIIDSQVDGISISIDSTNPVINDSLRVDPSKRGLKVVLKGLENLLALKNETGSRIKVGTYTVITKKNVDNLAETFDYFNNLIDYFIVQPVSLSPDHQLYQDLSLTEADYEELFRQISYLKQISQNTYIGNQHYLDELLKQLKSPSGSSFVSGCFGGRNLFFIQPDGTVWDCPSYLKIQQSLNQPVKNIKNQSFDQIFNPQRQRKNTDCNLFCAECLNMLQLMAFDEILSEHQHE